MSKLVNNLPDQVIPANEYSFYRSVHGSNPLPGVLNIYADTNYEVNNGKAIGNPLMCAEVNVSYIIIKRILQYYNEYHIMFRKKLISLKIC